MQMHGRMDLTNNAVAQAVVGLDMSAGRKNLVSVAFDSIKVKNLGPDVKVSFWKDGVELMSKRVTGLCRDDEVCVSMLRGEFDIRVET
jgi:hypothetical protein